MSRPEFRRTSPALSFEPVEMVDQEDWLYRPVDRGWCKYESLIDGTLDLADLAIMNDAIDVIEENRYRMQKAYEEKK